MSHDKRQIEATGNPLTVTPASYGVSSAHREGDDIGAIIAGPAARAAAAPGSQSIDPTRERSYWSVHFRARHYVEQGSSFADYGPAYAFGATARGRYPGRDFYEIETELSRDWPPSRGASSLSWEQARHAARDAWNRITSKRASA